MEFVFVKSSQSSNTYKSPTTATTTTTLYGTLARTTQFKHISFSSRRWSLLLNWLSLAQLTIFFISSITKLASKRLHEHGAFADRVEEKMLAIVCTYYRQHIPNMNMTSEQRRRRRRWQQCNWYARKRCILKRYFQMVVPSLCPYLLVPYAHGIPHRRQSQFRLSQFHVRQA